MLGVIRFEAGEEPAGFFDRINLLGLGKIILMRSGFRHPPRKESLN
jgi:hypothetical protein